MIDNRIIDDFRTIMVGHICPPKSQDARLFFLKKTIRRVALELSSFCNRRCSWCSNTYIDRISNRVKMDEQLYLSILKQLESFNFTGQIVLHGYNEPLADDNIFDRIRQLKDILPKCQTLLHTNGDYLTDELLINLEDAGLDSMCIMAYPDEGKVFNINDNYTKFEELKSKICLDLPFAEKRQIEYECLLHEAQFNNLNIKILASDLLNRGVDRGGSVALERKPLERCYPCARPFIHIEIQHMGHLLPCCHLRFDHPEHSPYILGDANEELISDIFFSEKACDFRRKMLSFSKKFSGPCQYCESNKINDAVENIAYFEEFLQTSPSDLHFEKDKVLSEGKRRRTDLARQQSELEAKRQADLARQQSELEAKRQADLARQQSELEAKRQAELARQKNELETKRLADLSQQKNNMEIKRLTDLANQKNELETKPILTIIVMRFKQIWSRMFSKRILRKRIQKEYAMLVKSNMFDANYYLNNNPDVAKSGMDPLLHFIQFGWKENRNPDAQFDVAYYLETYPDVRISEINPLIHYIEYGKIEGRVLPSPRQ